MDTSLGLLLERLLWPVPRVRWEASRALAQLVRSGADGVVESLCCWSAKRTLESECLLALGVIHAFELADFCPEDNLRRSIARPSFTSDWMLRTIYNSRERNTPFRYGVSPKTSPHVDEAAKSLFDEFNTMAVPPTFLRSLEELEGFIDFPIVNRWRHDWEWICRAQGVKRPKPDFFLGSGMSGMLNMPLGEILVSAYLRTLAYVTLIGKLSGDQAEFFALQALPLNRGLAALEPVKRPAWSLNLLQKWQDSKLSFTEKIWKQTRQSLNLDEIPAALRLVEADEKDFIEVEVDTIVGRAGFHTGKPTAHSPTHRWDEYEAGCLSGDILLDERTIESRVEPMSLAGNVFPVTIGRTDYSIAVQIRLACLILGWQVGRVYCGDRDVELRVANKTVSRWQHWYTNWEPSNFKQRFSDVSSICTVNRSWLQKYTELSTLSLALLVRVRYGTRSDTFLDLNVAVEEFWVNLDDSELFSISGAE